MNKLNIWVTFILQLYFVTWTIGQGELYQIDKVQEIKIYFAYDNWDYRLDTAKAGKENYILAYACYINGVKFDSVGVKYKGYSSYNNMRTKNPFHLKLNWIKDEQDYDGYTSIKLNNNTFDPAVCREVLGYKILQNYMDCAKANYSTVYVNDEYLGFYTNVEAINKKFCEEHFGSTDHVFVKGNPDRPSNNSTSNLVFGTNDSSRYYLLYSMENGYGWYKLMALMDTLKNNVNGIPKIVDVDRALWMHAFNSLFSNYDSYTGSFSQNYYLYEDDHGRFLPIIWDLNMCFGAFPGSGTGTIDKQAFFNQSNNNSRPLISKLLADPRNKRMYTAHTRTMIKEIIDNRWYEEEAKGLQTMIDSFVQTDINSLTNYSGFQNSLYGPLGSGFGTQPGIVTLMDARIEYIRTVPEYQAISPSIKKPQSIVASPIIGDTIWIQSRISNANRAWLSYRHNRNDLFKEVEMFDDGLHQDEQPGDQIYGAGFVPESHKTHYYIYAENDFAGQFSPERAQHEFYIQEALPPFESISKGEVVINEIMSANQKTALDPSDNNYDDWVELYNTTNSEINLSNLWISDNYSNPDKFIFKAGTIIPAKGRLIVWCDEDSQTGTGTHTNFRLSATGEQLMLSRPDGMVLDSISFGVLQPDYSFERCPDGTGVFRVSSKPTFNAPNCISGLDEKGNIKSALTLKPNPAHEYIEIDNILNENIFYFISDIHGRKFLEGRLGVNKQILNIHSLSSGLYLLNYDNFQGAKGTLRFVVK